jgi:hypothetical protein
MVKGHLGRTCSSNPFLPRSNTLRTTDQAHLQYIVLARQLRQGGCAVIEAYVTRFIPSLLPNLFTAVVFNHCHQRYCSDGSLTGHTGPALGDLGPQVRAGVALQASSAVSPRRLLGQSFRTVRARLPCERCGISP